MRIKDWFHHLLEPHCPDCKFEREIERQCKNCDTLRDLLEIEKFEKRELLRSILADKNALPEQKYEGTPQEVRPKTVSWRVRREMLEQEDRVKAQAIQRQQGEEKAAKQSVEELEKELGVING